jgi:succinate dehydrogenase/fumarate reductase flavoprotein subunit
MDSKDPKAPDSNVSRRDFVKATVGTVSATAMAGFAAESVEAASLKWDRVADVVIVGAGAAGLPAAIRARDLGASVIIVEANSDIGGHAMLSGGQISLGGGTSLQKKFGIVDSADDVYLEQTRPDHPTTRYAERKVVRAWADINAEAFEFLIANGVQFLPGKPTNKVEDGSVALRLQSTKPWSDDFNETINGAGGSGLARALEKSARAKGAEILLQHKMVKIVREQPQAGRVLGITVTNLKDNTTVNVRARKGVIGCTGGSSSNVVIRTIYDPRLTEEYNAGGEPW